MSEQLATALLALALSPAPASAQSAPSEAYEGVPEDCLPEQAAAPDLTETAACILLEDNRTDQEANAGLSLLARALAEAEADPAVTPAQRRSLRRFTVRLFGEYGRMDDMVAYARPLAGDDPTTRCLVLARVWHSLAADPADARSGPSAHRLDEEFGLAPCPRYVPESGWEPGQDAAFYERWYGNQLRAMGEPPLRGDADLAGSLRRFRLLVLPTFAPAYAVRIDLAGARRARLTWARLDGAGGYDPGELAETGTRDLQRSEWRRIARLLDRITAADLPQEDRPQGRDDTTIMICTDGTQYVFEELQPGHRTFLSRRFCGGGEADLFALIAATKALVPRIDAR